MGGVVSVALAITTVALVFVVFSSTNTAGIIQASTGGFANALSAALGKG